MEADTIYISTEGAVTSYPVFWIVMIMLVLALYICILRLFQSGRRR